MEEFFIEPAHVIVIDSLHRILLNSASVPQYLVVWAKTEASDTLVQIADLIFESNEYCSFP